MRKIVFLILFSTLLLSCNNKKQASLSGEIVNNTEDLYLLESFAIDNFDTLKIVDGKFSKNIDINESRISPLKIGDYFHKIFVRPGSSLEIYYDFEYPIDSIKYGGELKAENNILKELHKELEILDYMRIYTSTFEEAYQYIDSVENELNNIYISLAKKEKLDEEFIEYVKVDIKYMMAGFKLAIGFENNLITDSTFNALIDEYFILDEKLLNVPDYSGFISQYVALKARGIMIKEDNNGMEDYIKAKINVIEEISNSPIRDFLLFDLFKYLLIVESSEILDAHLPYFYDNVNTHKYVEYINDMLENKKLLAPGNLAPDFTYISLDSANVSLSDYRGKYVYIDFWATGCGGCRYDLPHLSKLQSDYKDENIVFLSLSLDYDWEQWSSVIDTEIGGGVHLFTGESFHQGAFKDYQVASIPTYVFVDTEGKFIDSRAPRPSTEKVRELFDEYVK